MASKNKKEATVPLTTHEGGIAVRINEEQQLRRSVLSCMLWENAYYEDGKEIADRIAGLVGKVNPKVVYDLAIEAREEMKLRHVPLFLACNMLNHPEHKKLVASLLERIVQRPDEMGEFIMLYDARYGNPTKSKEARSLPAQVKRGLAKAFTKFDAYQLGKYKTESKGVSLRDVLFLVHPKPKDADQQKVWDSLVNDTLAIPETWETQLSAGKNKKEVWETLLKNNKLGALALLRNLRNMQKAEVDVPLIKTGLEKMNTERVLPFRFISAAKHAPKLESDIEKTMLRALGDIKKLPGKTILVVDTSGSMYYGGNVSANSDITRVEAAGALAILIREIAENPVIYCTAGNDSTRKHATAAVPARRGFALSDVITKNEMQSQIGGGGIFLVQCLDYIYKHEKDADRIIIITDEQDCDTSGKRPEEANTFGKFNYLINVSVNRNGIGYKNKWVHLDGWSESIVKWISEYESNVVPASDKN